MWGDLPQSSTKSGQSSVNQVNSRNDFCDDTTRNLVLIRVRESE